MLLYKEKCKSFSQNIFCEKEYYIDLSFCTISLNFAY